ncbi:Nramp family divalent metal transporter [Pseudanabaena sp. 'Roaring Creek']|uniref:Nramp family divalent metal transporter n=1 Tax=Pseudanabaena sp. 'Roaring Creek' TaxID=1681830 RepID=UPI0006D7A299
MRLSLPKIPTAPFCPSEVQGTVIIPSKANSWQKFLVFAGPGLLISVGYMDPGNWATDIEGGSKFGYSLLSIIFISNAIAILLQALCVRLGMVTGLDLAQACRLKFSLSVNILLWILAEIAIIACDLAEILGSALALNLLFHLPLIWGVFVTGLDLVVVLWLQGKGFRWLEAIVLGLISTIAICFLVEIVFARPDWNAVFQGYLPQPSVLGNSEQLYLAVSILGATVMPHNLYLHSAIVQTRKWQEALPDVKSALHYATLDSTIALIGALFINSAILIVAAATFHFSGNQQVAEIQDAYQLLTPLLGSGLASFLFGLALLASGQSSTFTGTIAGQVVMEGFLNLMIPCWLRRLITRCLAIAPAVIGLSILGEQGVGKLLVFSQVVLSLQLPFAIVPLVLFTGSSQIMGKFANPFWIKGLAWLIAGLIIVVNIWLLAKLLT